MKQLSKNVFEYLRSTDYIIWLSSIGLSVLSLVLLTGILQTDYVDLLRIVDRNLLVQAVAIALGVVAALVISVIDYRLFTKFYYLHYVPCYLLLLLTFVIGYGAAGREEDLRWLNIPIIDVGLQPAEFLKISFIIAFAYHLSKIHDNLNHPINVIGLGIHGAIPVILIQLQGDSGTALLFGITIVVMVFTAGLSYKYIALAGGAAVVALPIAWFYILDDFQQNRILALFLPDSTGLSQYTYQQDLSLIAIGSGMAGGKGIFADNHAYVPEIHNDFIFAFVAESLGFVGALAVVAVVSALCVKIFINSMTATSVEGKFICVGIASMLSAQILTNIGMCLSLFPVMGKTFPFLSYGGSSMLSNFIIIGVALSVKVHSKKEELFG